MSTAAHHSGTPSPDRHVLDAAGIERWRNNIRNDTFGRYHYEMAAALEREGSRDAAIAAYERCLEILPDMVDAYARLEALHVAAGDHPAAQAVRQRAQARVAAYDREAKYRLALGAFRHGDTEQAADLCRSNLADYPTHPLSRELLGLALIRQNRIAEGIATFAPDAALGETLAPDLAEQSLEVGLKLNQDGRFAEAIRVLQRAALLDPEAVPILNVLAWALRNVQAYDAAADAMRRAVAANPFDARLQQDYGNQLLLAARAAPAAEAFEQATRLSPTGNSYAFLGMARHLAGDFEQAAAAFRTALTLPDGAGQGWIIGYLGLSLCAQGRTDEGLADLRQAWTLAKSADWSHLFLGLGQLAAGRHEAAAAAARRAVALSPENSWQYMALAAAVSASGDDDRALAACRRALIARAGQLPYEAGMTPWAAETLRALYRRLGVPAALDSGGG